MGKVQELRHSVRTDLVSYARKNPDSFKAHMTASAVVWLLAGRPGLSRQEQLSLVARARTFVASLAADDVSLVGTLATMDALLATVQAKAAAAAGHVADPLVTHAADFDAWAAQLAAEDTPGT